MIAFRRIIGAAALWTFFLPALAIAQTNYLKSPDALAAAWDILTDEIGDTDLLWLKIEPQSVAVLANTQRNGEFYNAWIVEHVVENDEGRDVLRGPGPLSWGPTFLLTEDPFRPSDLNIGDLAPILQDAIAHLRLADPGEAVRVEAGTSPILGTPGPALRWSIHVEAPREFGQVLALVDGTIYGADISHTIRGRSIDLRAQADWPFDVAEAGFHRIVGEGPFVHEIKVLTHGIEVEAASAAKPDKTRDYRWNGGMFTSLGLEKPVLPAIASRGDMPFALTEAGLSRLPAILNAAREAAPDGWAYIDGVRATKPPAPQGEPTVLWIVELKRAKGDDEKAVIRVRPDASVFSAALPESQRAYDSYLSLAGAQDAVAQFQTALGPDAAIFELTFRPDRASALLPDPDDPGSLVEYTLDNRGITRGIARPRIMESDADLIPLSRAAQFNGALLSEAAGMVVSAYGVPKAEIFMVKIWNGAPFWRNAAGVPYLQMRVGVPPRHNASGQAIFTIEGEFVEAMR